MRRRPLYTALAACALALSLFGCRTTDARGEFEVTWSGHYRLTLQIGGARHHAEVVEGDVVELGGRTVDLGELCAREEVQCPHETFADRVRVAQPKWPDGTALRLIDVDTDRGVSGTLHPDGRFVAGLRGRGAAQGECVLLEGSAVSGFMAPNTGVAQEIRDGRVTGALAGACAIGPAIAGAVLTLETTFTAARVAE